MEPDSQAYPGLDGGAVQQQGGGGQGLVSSSRDRYHAIACPPSRKITWPVMNAEASEAR